jgi:hypothetical protein
MNNPLSNFRNPVVIAMLNEICIKRRIKPDSLIESLVKAEYQKLK